MNSIVAAARNCNLDKDIKDLPDESFNAKDFTEEQRDTVVGKVYRRLMEIESRLLPCGLHTVGVPPTAEEAVATLVNIAGIDRPEDSIKSLPRLIADSIGRDIEQIYRSANDGKLDDVALLQKITEAQRAAVRALVQRSTDSSGRVKEVVPILKQGLNFLSSLSGGTPWKKALGDSGFSNVSDDMLAPLFDYLEFCLKQIVADNEVGALVEALEGKFILPGPGGDRIRNPEVLPTGKNMHGLDPQSIPTTAAVDVARVVVEARLRQLPPVGGLHSVGY